ncbi:MAG: hypothetical protein IKX30_15125 [Victivallales bacterium]|nr:hypothetical protein [Victivallales bacterium]MBR5080068.1 hypothetical protein [Victivallales bacterium]
MKSYLNKSLAFFVLCFMAMTPWATLRAQQLDVGVQNRSGVQHTVNAKSGTTTTAQKPTAVVNPKILPLPPKEFVPKVRWHQSNLERHWDKHKAEFPEFKTAKEYGDAALYFFSKPPQGTLTKVDKETGDKKYYHQTSNTFGVTTSQGIPKTMFRPSAGINYWRRQ